MLYQRKKSRYAFLIFTALIVIIEILALSPTPLEENRPVPSTMALESLVESEEASLIDNLPKKQISEYKVQKFQYVSVQNGEKIWKIQARKASLYQAHKLVHGREVIAHLFNPDGAITTISGLEAKYLMNEKDLEIYGQVHTVFPDGFQINSDYLRYRPALKKIEIPNTYPVSGHGVFGNNERFVFHSYGLDYNMKESLIYLLKTVNVSLFKFSSKKSNEQNSQGLPEETNILSDACTIYRAQNLAHFTMDPDKLAALRFVHITQPDLYTRSRRADLHYGDFTKIMKYLTAYDDVFIKEKNKDTPILRYATSGKAEFDTESDRIILTQFPQVYEGESTVTGDVVVLHRGSGLVEVKNSNSFSYGQSE